MSVADASGDPAGRFGTVSAPVVRCRGGARVAVAGTRRLRLAEARLDEQRVQGLPGAV
jgi:hypothetical protein